MLGLILEVGIRTSVWILSKGCQGIYYLCFGSSNVPEGNAVKKQKELEYKISVLEERIKTLENS